VTAEPAGEGTAEQPYQALYRRYRPQRFSEVLGQEHVTRALRHAVAEGKVAHAYLFSGPRGTGKTSTARILAMALNCAHPSEGEPDGTCPSCVAIRQGSSMDVQELDAASNRKLDEMRDLLSRVPLGTPGRWKVYIIDEVHQLTSDSASALLKTLEEPPAHVIFVLATTDPQKVLPTIRSRTQHFEFRLLGADVLSGLLHEVSEKATLAVPEGAIDAAVRQGHGSARDALSVLDQVAAAGVVADDTALVDDVVDALADRDPGRVLVAVAEAISSGRDARRLAEAMLQQLRNGFLAIQAKSLVLVPDDSVASVEAQAHRLGTPALVRAMEVIGQAIIDMRDAVDPRITLEVALVRLADADADDSRAALLERIDRLERLIGEKGNPAPASPPRTQPSSPQTALGAHRTKPGREPTTGAADPPSSAGTGPAPPAGSPGPAGATSPGPAAGATGSGPAVGATGPAPPAGRATASAAPSTAPATPRSTSLALPTREELTMAWGDKVLPSLRPGVKVYLSSGRFLAVDDSAAIYAVPDQGLLSRAEPLRAEVETALADHFGRPVPLRLVIDEAQLASMPTGRTSPPPVEDPADYDLSGLEDAPAPVISPEQRLLEAFPGAEEVTP
jgi:DNA polymerase-3 subunit gamma/tau